MSRGESRGHLGFHRGQSAAPLLRAFAVAGSALALGVALVAPQGCGDYGPVTLADVGDGGILGAQIGRGVGAACSAGEPCRAGLSCQEGKCAPAHLLDEGAACILSSECKEGLYCSAERKCRGAGRAAAGDSCTSDADCKTGTRCNAVGLSAECAAEGAGDVFAACRTGADCFGGLLCTAAKCTAPPASSGAPPIAISGFAGVACEDETAAPPRAHFRVPRGDASDGDFFRLPFPNDVRRKAGRPSLAGFPTPGSDVLGYDIVERYRAYVEANADGFSPYSSVVFRFGGPIDFETFKTKDAIRFVDLTAAADVGFGWAATSGRSPYLCGSSMTIRPTPGEPLAQGHTFAVLVSDAAKAKGGGAIEVPADLKALVSATDPGAPLSDGWAAYASLRAWATANGYDLGKLVTATVFTTGSPQKVVDKTAAVVAASAVPPIKGWVKCGTAPSPCPDAQGERACPAGGDAQFDELHALVTLPVLQKGTPPWRASEGDGDVVLGADGTPGVQTSQDVCLSLSVPKNAVMPAGGWPLVVYAHDVGDHFRSHVVRGLAKRLATADTSAAAVAVLGFDQVAHGTRKPAGVSSVSASLPTWSPGAMRGVSVQGAADVLGVLRAARALSVPQASSPTGNAIKTGPVVLFGHGQGAAYVSLAAPRSDAEGVVLAGHGGSFLDLVPKKTRAVNLFGVAPTVLGEPSLSASSPVLSLLQTAVDPVDPLVHAADLVASGSATKRHVFMVYGQGDSYQPAPTQIAYAVAAGLAVATPTKPVTADETIAPTTVAVPVSGNIGGAYTAVVRQYPAGSDGHAVVFADTDAANDTDRFVADVARALVPRIGR